MNKELVALELTKLDMKQMPYNIQCNKGLIAKIFFEYYEQLELLEEERKDWKNESNKLH